MKFLVLSVVEVSPPACRGFMGIYWRAYLPPFILLGYYTIFYVRLIPLKYFRRQDMLTRCLYALGLFCG